MAVVQANPSSDIFVTTSIVGGSSAFGVLSGLARSPSTPSVGTYVEPTVTGQEVIVHTTDVTKSPASTLVSVKAFVYTARPTGASILVEIYLGGTLKASDTFTAGADGWQSVTWTSGDLTQTEIADIRFRFVFTYSGTEPQMFASYMELATTQTTITFTPVPDSYTPAVAPIWRPRLKPGAFWV